MSLTNECGCPYGNCDCDPVVAPEPPAPKPRRPMPKRTCCADMQAHLNRVCTQHPDPWACTDYTLVRATAWCDRRKRRVPCVGIPVRDGGSSFIVIAFCPWCGKRVPGPEAP